MPQHFRDRVLLPQRTQNIPQLPSGRRTSNVPGISQLGQNATTLVTVVVNIYTIDKTATITSLVPTQTTSATSP